MLTWASRTATEGPRGPRVSPFSRITLDWTKFQQQLAQQIGIVGLAPDPWDPKNGQKGAFGAITRETEVTAAEFGGFGGRKVLTLKSEEDSSKTHPEVSLHIWEG